MRGGQSPLLLLDVVEILAREGVDYAVIGALAAAVYGAIRASADADADALGGPQDLKDARIALNTAERLDLDLLRKVTRRFGRPAADALESLLA